MPRRRGMDDTREPDGQGAWALSYEVRDGPSSDRLFCNVDPGPLRPSLNKHAVPALWQERRTPLKEPSRICGGHIDAAVTSRPTESVVPKRRVKREVATKVHCPGNVLDTIRSILALKVVHRCGDMLGLDSEESGWSLEPFRT